MCSELIIMTRDSTWYPYNGGHTDRAQLHVYWRDLLDVLNDGCVYWTWHCNNYSNSSYYTGNDEQEDFVSVEETRRLWSRFTKTSILKHIHAQFIKIFWFKLTIFSLFPCSVTLSELFLGTLAMASWRKTHGYLHILPNQFNMQFRFHQWEPRPPTWHVLTLNLATGRDETT